MAPFVRQPYGLTLMTDLTEDQRWILRALAQSAEVQASLFPKGIMTPDALAGAFDGAFCDEEGNLLPGFDPAIEEIDRIMLAHSGPENLPHWQASALSDDPMWETIRTLARRALEAYGIRPFAPHGRLSDYAVEPAPRSGLLRIIRRLFQ